MLKYFTGSYIFTLAGFILAYLWTLHTHTGNPLASLFIVFVLSILEVSLSFDNAVINAGKLEKMSPLWQHRFLTWGILIAVFGMRFLFPVCIVSIFAIEFNLPLDVTFILSPFVIILQELLSSLEIKDCKCSVLAPFNVTSPPHITVAII